MLFSGSVPSSQGEAAVFSIPVTLKASYQSIHLNQSQPMLVAPPRQRWEGRRPWREGAVGREKHVGWGKREGPCVKRNRRDPTPLLPSAAGISHDVLSTSGKGRGRTGANSCACQVWTHGEGQWSMSHRALGDRHLH